MPTKLGQNFLKNKDVIKKIVESADFKPNDFVLEIGPGKGALSFEIKKQVKKLIMVEKDRELADNMARNFKFKILNLKSYPKTDSPMAKISNDKIYKLENGSGIISSDILEINLSELIKQNNFQNYKVVANIPYYITSPIIRKFLEAEFPPKFMILMVQKEVAERICAKPGQMSILATSVQYYAKPEILFQVGKENFDPVPKVDSAVIRISMNREQGIGNREKSKDFFRVVRAGFSAKRKTLVNNLANSFHLEKSEVEKKLEKIGIKKSSRAQELSVEDWKKMTKIW